MPGKLVKMVKASESKMKTRCQYCMKEFMGSQRATHEKLCAAQSQGQQKKDFLDRMQKVLRNSGSESQENAAIMVGRERAQEIIERVVDGSFAVNGLSETQEVLDRDKAEEMINEVLDGSRSVDTVQQLMNDIIID